MDIEELIRHDLSMSGLLPSDIHIRPLEMAERTACGIAAALDGYVIPYFDMLGKPLPFYRTRIFGGEYKYKQLRNTPNHVYFPPGFLDVVKHSKVNYIILTEGEKKAAAACKQGFPAIAFGGVDSWRNRILLLPKDTQFNAYSYSKGLIEAKLPTSGWDPDTMLAEPVAHGFVDLINLLRNNNLQAIIIYDSDETTTPDGMKFEVQRAASNLGFELRSRGVPIRDIRQAILPNISGTDKTGIDDLLCWTGLFEGKASSGKQILSNVLATVLAKRAAFPKHPNLQVSLNKKLQNSKISRKDLQNLSLSLLTDLDSRGIRMYSKSLQQHYYFEEKTAILTKVELPSGAERFRSTPFSNLLYEYYGLSTSADNRLLQWLVTQFTGEPPIEDVSPCRVITLSGDGKSICYQIGNGRYAKISSDPKNPIQILYNGSEGILFEEGHVIDIDSVELLAEFKKRSSEPLVMWWEDVLQEVRLKNHGHVASLFSMLYYLSPWLHRWRGTQLPVELVVGEAGSGKSTLYELRLEILTGHPNLRNAPEDIKDWHASITNSGGLHVTDNVQLTDKSLRQRLSDEICRLITEPRPHIEKRKYFTTADLMRVPVSSVFAFTSIIQPFTANDLIQRSVILELDKLSQDTSVPIGNTHVTFDSSWKSKQIDKFGGRIAWISHQLYVLHKFLHAVETKWNPEYSAIHRLINLEQSLVILADLMGLDSSWIPKFLMGQTEETVVTSDWTLEGIKAFCEVHHKTTKDSGLAAFDARTISDWAASQEAFMDCHNLTNSRKLGRYIQTHKSLIHQITGLLEGEKRANRSMYHLAAKPL